jgi:hypothetical protein
VVTAAGTAAAGDAAALLKGLKDEAALYRAVLEVSGEELALVKAAELEKATGSLSRKQQLLEDIAGIETAIRPLKERWPTLKASLDSGAQAEFAGVLKELSTLLERLIEIERETERVLEGQIAAVRRKWPAPAAEERARKAYGAQKGPEGKR